jgi:hypothetical protein
MGGTCSIHGDKKEVHRVLRWENLRKKDQLEDRRRLKHNIKMDQKVRWNIDWIYLAQDKDR